MYYLHIVLCPQYLVRKEIHETLKEAAGLRPLLFSEMDDTGRLGAVSALKETIPYFHSSEDVLETQSEILMLTDVIVYLLAVFTADVFRDSAGLKVAEQDSVFQDSDSHVLYDRIFFG